MSYNNTLIALGGSGGKMVNMGQMSYAQIDTSLMYDQRLFNDVSDDVGYKDEATVVQKLNFPNYYLPTANERGFEVRTWFVELPEEVSLIVVYRTEEESGYND